MIHQDITAIAVELEIKAAELRDLATQVEALEQPGSDQIAALEAQIASLLVERDAALVSLAEQQAALTDAQAQATASQAALAAQVAANAALQDQATLLVAQLAAEEQDDAAMLAQIEALEAALAEAQAGGTPPPVGQQCRISGGNDVERGGPWPNTLFNYRVLSADLKSIVATGTVLTGPNGQYSIDFVGPFAVGDAVPVLMDRFDSALSPFDRTVYAGLGWDMAVAV